MGFERSDSLICHIVSVHDQWEELEDVLPFFVYYTFVVFTCFDFCYLDVYPCTLWVGSVMVQPKTTIRWWSWQDYKGSTRSELSTEWYTIIIYGLPLQERII